MPIIITFKPRSDIEKALDNTIAIAMFILLIVGFTIGCIVKGNQQKDEKQQIQQENTNQLNK